MSPPQCFAGIRFRIRLAQGSIERAVERGQNPPFEIVERLGIVVARSA
jgi:hypothetical protein